MDLAGSGGRTSVREVPSYSRRVRGNERAWIRGAQGGSVPDLEQLFRAHWPRAYRAAYLIVHDAAAAEDIAQESFIAAVRALDRFDRRRPFGPWLHRIVANRSIDWARARTARAEVELGEPPAAAVDGHPDTGDAMPIAAGLLDLSPEHRAVIVLRYLLDYRPGEIAELLELPRGTVNSRLRRALDQLGAQLGE
jgi:RNA polymerase sigma-70 factor (ECF subfamily)